jgi:two-component system KDP operon response regulator KdpE
MSEDCILVVDDEPQIQRFLKPALRAAGYDVLSAETGAQALKAIATSAPDVVILDLGLPDIEGKQIIREVRAWSRVPIIVLSARDRESEKIAALDLGADDYVEKPFAIGELLARIRAALRHKAQDIGESARVEVDGLVIDTVKRIVTRNGQPIRLTPTEYDLLAILVRHCGRVVTHRQLLGSVWGPAHVEDTQYLRVFIGQLRAKIEADPANPRIIQTEPSIGYRFVDAQY